jgi:hypothetical protein
MTEPDLAGGGEGHGGMLSKAVEEAAKGHAVPPDLAGL